MSKEKYPRKINWDTYKFRCSSLGNLMPGLRATPGKLQQTQLSELSKIFLKEVYGFEKQVSTKQMEKGEYCEPKGIDIVCKEVYPKVPYLKNTKRFENEFISGTPDLVAFKRKSVHDIKSSWDLDTFHRASVDKSNDFQIKGYGWLLGYSIMEIDKVLMSAPEHIRDREVRYLEKKYVDMGIAFDSPEFESDLHRLEMSLNYDRIPVSDRLKRFTVEFDPDFADFIRDNVLILRNELKNMSL